MPGAKYILAGPAIEAALRAPPLIYMRLAAEKIATEDASRRSIFSRPATITLHQLLAFGRHAAMPTPKLDSISPATLATSLRAMPSPFSDDALPGLTRHYFVARHARRVPQRFSTKSPPHHHGLLCAAMVSEMPLARPFH